MQLKSNSLALWVLKDGSKIRSLSSRKSAIFDAYQELLFLTLSQNSQIFFKGINSLRFFAALAVIITHIELLKGSFGLTNYWKNPLFFNLGGLGVYFFFVLSGFLITYLLLVEKEKFGKISIKQFYVRRILRIWPLYYLILIIGFFVLPRFDVFHIGYLQKSFEANFYPNLILYLLILPNLAFSLYPAVPNIGQTWSIGVEEQFYIFWPIIIAKSKNILKTLFTITIALILVKIGVLILGIFFSYTDWFGPLKLFVAMSKFECMSIGGIGAYYLHRGNRLLKYAYKPYAFIASLGLSVILIYFTPQKIQDGIHLIYAVLFLQIILFTIRNSGQIALDNQVFSYLGKISFGLYMYHFMVIPLCLYIYTRYLKSVSEISENVIIYSGVISLTILVSALSYHFFELKFIRLKSRFSPVRSGDHP